MTGVLGLERCAAAGGDMGGVVIYDLGLRFPGFVVRQCLFNTVPPVLTDQYEEAGIPREVPREVRMAADYFIRQGTDADALAAELDTPEKRRRYIAQFYGSRFWAAPGAFTSEDVDFMTEPFADADKLRAGFGVYETALRTRAPAEVPRFFETNPVPTLVLYGPEDHVIPRDFPERCEVAFPERVGPLVVPRAGHFLQWERADVLNQSLVYFFADLRG
jgi:pimeloyl-ACP methyl ester carboxylesterase